MCNATSSRQTQDLETPSNRNVSVSSHPVTFMVFRAIVTRTVWPSGARPVYNCSTSAIFGKTP